MYSLTKYISSIPILLSFRVQPCLIWTVPRAPRDSHYQEHQLRPGPRNRLGYILLLLCLLLNSSFEVASFDNLFTEVEADMFCPDVAIHWVVTSESPIAVAAWEILILVLLVIHRNWCGDLQFQVGRVLTFQCCPVGPLIPDFATQYARLRIFPLLSCRSISIGYLPLPIWILYRSRWLALEFLKRSRIRGGWSGRNSEILNVLGDS